MFEKLQEACELDRGEVRNNIHMDMVDVPEQGGRFLLLTVDNYTQRTDGTDEPFDVDRWEDEKTFVHVRMEDWKLAWKFSFRAARILLKERKVQVKAYRNSRIHVLKPGSWFYMDLGGVH